MLTPKRRWQGALLLCTLLLVWRLLDFLDEAQQGYHMTRIGLSLFGRRAEWLQLLLILACLGGVLLCLGRLWWLRRPAQSPRQ